MVRARDQIRCPACGYPAAEADNNCGNCGQLLAGEIADDGVPVATEATVALPAAGFLVRMVSWFIDLAFVVLADIAIIHFWPGVGLGAYVDPQVITPVRIEQTMLIVNASYYTFGPSVWETTIGKRLFGLYIVRPNGASVGPVRALIRCLAYLPSSMFCGVGFFLAVQREDNRALHDLICDTVVVRGSPGGSARPIGGPPVQ